MGICPNGDAILFEPAHKVFSESEALSCEEEKKEVFSLFKTHVSPDSKCTSCIEE